MTDEAHRHIAELVEEEHALRSGTERTDEDRARLKALEVELDRAWDLLRRRDALRSAGESTAGTEERPAKEVEGYLQ